MCARFEVKVPFQTLSERYGLTGFTSNAFQPGEVRPTDVALMVTGDGAHMAHFGLAVDWQAAPVINARAETVAGKPTFRPLLEQRCVVPASAWIEWRKDGAARHRNRIHGDSLFSLAGLYQDDRFVILTCPPVPAIAHVHDRMPVVLAGDALSRWLGPAPFADVARLLEPYRGPLIAEEDAPRQGSLFG